MNVPTYRGKRVVIIRAGNSSDWVLNCLLLSSKNISYAAADYQEDKTSSLFENWFEKTLSPIFLPLIEKQVIVMDNGSYHSRLKNKTPTMATRKDDILIFMRQHPIQIPETSMIMCFMMLRSGH